MRGAEALSVAIVIVLLCWLTDLVDGPLARHDADTAITWVGKHDAEANLASSLGLTAYLVFSGYPSGWLGALLVLLMLSLWLLHSHQLAWPFYVLPYVILGIVACRRAPLFGWLAIGYVLTTLAVRWSRLRSESLPESFQAVAGFFGKNSGPC
jgi:hypothetical protein